MIFLFYAAKVTACSAILFGYYFFFLRNRKFHQYNRFYLLLSTAFSVVFPLIYIPVFNTATATADTLITTLKVISLGDWEEAFVLTAHRNHHSFVFNLQNITITVYFAGLTICSLLVIRSLLYIRTLTKRYTKEMLGSVSFYNTREPGTPFSFFSSLFWNEKISQSSDTGQHILKHELYHIQSQHSLDILYAQLLNTAFWFNPIFHLVLKELRAIHEFLADECASASAGKYEYAELLVTEAMNNHASHLSSHFFHNQIKRRITMIIKHNHSSFSYARKIMALPLLFAMFCAFTRTAVYRTVSNELPLKSAEPITVVIDAGHGGSDPGARSETGKAEKDFTLSIAQTIRQLSEGYGIHVIMTRNADELPDHALNTADGLKNRVTISKKNKADLFISLHLNEAGNVSRTNAKNGFDIFVSSRNQQFEKSKILASAIAAQIKNTYTISGTLKETNKAYILTKLTVPAILIECGFMSDKADLDFIGSRQNQEKIARDILKGIVQFQRNGTAASQLPGMQENRPVALPAPELSKAVQEHPKEGFSLTDDTVTNMGVIKFMKGDTVIARLAEVKSFRSKDSVPQEGTAARYPGGISAWTAYLTKNLHFPKEALKNAIQGTVIVQFAVSDQGKVSKVEALSGPTAGGLREEAIRLIQQGGSWIPSVQDGHPVASVKKQPFVFRL